MDNNNNEKSSNVEENSDGIDWRTHFSNENRQLVISKIVESIKKHVSDPLDERSQELRELAIRFEEKLFSASSSQTEYVRRISMKMITMDKKPQSSEEVSSLPSTSTCSNQNPSDSAASQSEQSQVGNRGLPVSIPSANQPQTKLLPQAIDNNMASTGAQISGNLNPSITGLSDNAVTSGVGQSYNMQNLIGNSVGPYVPSNIFANTQRQIQGKSNMQQVMTQQQHQQQSQNSNQFVQNYQHPSLKKRRGNVQQTLIQQQQQQNLIQQIQLQSSKQPSGTNTEDSNQTTLQQSQSGFMQTQQSTSQQLIPTILQQNPQSSLRQRLSQHSLNNHQKQQQTQMAQQSMIPSQHNHLLGQVNNAMEQQQQQHHQQKWFGRQNSLSSMQHQQQQQQVLCQNDVLSFHQQQLGSQNNVPELKQQQQQQQQMLGNQTGIPNMQAHQQSMRTLQARGAAQQQKPAMLLSTQGQQAQSLRPPQPTHLQQQIGLEKQTNFFQQGFIQSQNPIDQQKQFLQLQRMRPETSSTLVDSMPSRGQTSGGDEQEEVFQKMKSLKEMYLSDLTEIYKRTTGKLQQATKPEEVELLKRNKLVLERLISYLHAPKHNTPVNSKEKLLHCEKQILHIMKLYSLKRSLSSQQQQFQLPRDHLSESEVSPLKHQENQIKPQTQIKNLRSSQQIMHQNIVSNMQYGSMSCLPNHMGIPPVHPSTMNTLRPNMTSSGQQTNVNTSSANITSMLPPNMIHHQHMKQRQEHQFMQTPQLKQHFQRKLMMQQQQQHEQQILRQQNQELPILQQQQHNSNGHQKLPQLAHSLVEQIPQVHQSGEVCESTTVISEHLSSVQDPGNNHQELKTCATFPISSPQLLQALSPQLSQNSSPQIDQQVTFVSKEGTPFQSTHSPSIKLSPSSPLASYPSSNKPEKQNSGLSPLSDGANNGQSQTPNSQIPHVKPLVITTPEVSASPFLEDFISSDNNRGRASTIVSDKPIALTNPTQHLYEVVKSLSLKATYSAAMKDIGAATNMVDMMTGSVLGNGSRASIGEDLAGITKSNLQDTYFISFDGIDKKKKSSVIVNGLETSELESTATSRIKRCRFEMNPALLQEINGINHKLINTVVDISDEDINLNASPGEGIEGIIIKCSFSPITLSSAQMPVLPIHLLISDKYPDCSPILLDKSPVKLRNEYENLVIKATSKFNTSLRCLSEPISLEEMARYWDACAYEVVNEYARENGGGNFSSRYGRWEKYVSAA